MTFASAPEDGVVRRGVGGARRATDLDGAVERAAAALAAQQRTDGSWNTDTDIGPAGMATQLLVESLFGALP
jgi:hypothetical protein